MTSHGGHKNENKPNSFPWPARPYMVRPWLPLQIHFPGSSPSPCPAHTGLLLSQGLFTSFCWQHSYPDFHMVVSSVFTSQLKHPLWPILSRWSKHTTHSHSATWPHLIFFIAFTGIWHVLNCFHAFSLCHPTGMHSLRTGTLSCSPLYPPASRTAIGTQVEIFSRLLGRRGERTGQEIWIGGCQQNTWI